jgi:Ser/Thr protein kinase RdoA (MazF antagonist)
VGTKEDASVVAATVERVWGALREFGEGPEGFGLLHGDLHHGNTLFQAGQVGAIDFDDCGDGPWLYDLAVTLSALRERPDFIALREALLTGYRQVRPLPEEQEARLEALLALRALQDMLWKIEERDQPAFRDRWQAQMASSLQALRRYVGE